MQLDKKVVASELGERGVSSSTQTKNQKKKMNSMKLTLHKFLGAGVALAGLALVSNAHADVEVLFGGGNASQTVLYDRVTNILTGGISGVWVSPTNSTVRSYRGTISTQPGLGTVTIGFSLLGAVTGFQGPGQSNLRKHGFDQQPASDGRGFQHLAGSGRD